MEIGLFVYGTLRTGAGRPATIFGTLWDLGAFPGATDIGLVNAGEIKGEILHVTPKDLAHFDRYEGVDRGLYRRVRTLTTDSEIVWVYEYSGKTRGKKIKEDASQ